MPDIKKKESIKSVKEFVGGTVRDKINVAGIKATDTVTNQVQNSAPLPQKGKEAEKAENYATDNITEKSKAVAEDTAVIMADTVRGAEKKIKEKYKEKQRSQIKTYEKSEIRNNVRAEKTVKSVADKEREIKTTEKSAEIGKRTIKTATESVKKTEEIKAEAQAMRKSAQMSKAAAQKTAQITEKATKKSVEFSKKTVEAFAKGAKALALAIKDLIVVLAESGPVVLIIILVILAAGLAGTFLGIFLTNDETTGSEMTMTQAVSIITADYYDNINKLGNGKNYDTMEIDGNVAINWKDVLSVYAVKYTNANDGFEVATINEDKLKKLKQIVFDMNPSVGVVVSKVVPVLSSTVDKDGKETVTTTYQTKKVLVVTSTHISATVQSDLYHFSKDEKAQLTELTSSTYDDLWTELIGATGDVIKTNSSHTPKGIFTWPLQEDNYVSSSFAWRHDPITGVWKQHKGTDIAADYGTPILAAADGEVVVAGWDDSYGNYVKIKHNNVYSTLYAHCSSLNVTVGQTVKQGQVIAQVGSTGYSTGNHLHFEVWFYGERVNALNYFN